MLPTRQYPSRLDQQGGVTGAELKFCQLRIRHGPPAKDRRCARIFHDHTGRCAQPRNQLGYILIQIPAPLTARSRELSHKSRRSFLNALSTRLHVLFEHCCCS